MGIALACVLGLGRTKTAACTIPQPAVAKKANLPAQKKGGQIGPLSNV
jgi:hypothetical protein